jgi:hypothetical protein
LLQQRFHRLPARHAAIGSTPVDPDVGTSAPSGPDQALDELVPDLPRDEGSFGADSVAAPTTVTMTDTTPTTHPNGTRLKHSIRQPKVCTDATVTYSAVKTSSETTSYTTAMKDPLWRQTMNDEFQALLKNKTWHLIPPRVDINIIDYKWVFQLKHKLDGSIDHHKARLVAKGFKQQYGVDYDNTFNPMVKPTTIRVLLSLVISRGWAIRHIDIQNAFLHGLLDEDVYMKQPSEFVDCDHPIYICKLDKSLYGLKQSPRAWFSHLSSKLLQLDFKAFKVDVSLFIFSMAGIQIYMLIYVDDIIIIISSSTVATEKLLAQLWDDFTVKDLDTLNYFLGIEVHHTSQGLIPTQHKYIHDLLSRINMLNSKGVPTPMLLS